LVEELTKN